MLLVTPYPWNQATCMKICEPFVVPCHEVVHNFPTSHCTIILSRIVIDPRDSFPYLVWRAMVSTNQHAWSFFVPL